MAGLPTRGRVYFIDVGDGDKPFLVVSNNARNTALDTFLAVRITTTRKRPLDSIIELTGDDPLVGRVLCDEILLMYRDEIRRDAGALSAKTMMRISDGLRAALAL